VSVSRLLKKAISTTADRRNRLSHNVASIVCAASGTGLLACPSLFQQPVNRAAARKTVLQLRLARLAIAFLLAASLAVAGGPKIFFSKSFPGAVPAYFSVAIGQGGQCEYKESPDEDSPVRFQLAPEETAAIFSLADRLDRFARPLEARAHVANMGVKTLRYEDGAVKNEVKFNYSPDPNAGELWDWFERVSESEQLYAELDRAIRHDRLGVNDALLRIETARDRKRLTAAGQFLPLLDRVAKDEAFIHMARERAAALAERFRAQGLGSRP